MSVFSISRTEEAILMAIQNREMYGLQIIEIIKEASEGRYKISFGTLYPALHRLDKIGLVDSRWGEEKPEERGGARRKYYKINGLGERALAAANRFRNNLIKVEAEPAFGGG